MNQTIKKYKLIVEFINLPIAVGAEKEVEVISDTFLQTFIWDGAVAFKEMSGESPKYIFVKVISDNGEVVESKIYSFDWNDNNTFRLIERKVAINSKLIELSRDIEGDINAEINQYREKKLLIDINEALDNKNKKEFLRLTEALKQLQKEKQHD